MGTSASFALARKTIACLVAALLSLALVPASALAEDGHSGVEGSEGAFGSEVPTSPQPPSDPSTEASGSPVILSEGSEAAEVEGSNERPLTLASGLAGKPSSFINSDVALDSEPVIGSFTVDGLTYAVMNESHVELVGVAPSVILSEGSEAAGVEGSDSNHASEAAGVEGSDSNHASEAAGVEGSDSNHASEAAGVEGSDSNHASEAGLANLALPESISYENATYTLTSIAPYAFYLSGVASVTLPASVSDVDDRAFRSSDVASVTVAEGNPTYSSFDGALYSADKTRLLLIPEGRVGAVLLPKETEVAEASKFSHCSLVDAISVEDGAAFASENGLLYTSDLTTLLRIPAGVAEITIREGCTTIAAGALEACAKLMTINAPATVASISPDVFHAIPTVSLPAASVILSEGGEGPEVEESNESYASGAGAQITAIVALSSGEDDLPEVVALDITVNLSDDAVSDCWESMGFAVSRNDLLAEDEVSDTQEAAPYGAGHSSYVYCENPWYRNSLSSGATLEGPTNEWFHVNGGTMTKFRLHEGVLYFDSSAHGGAYIHIGLTKNLDGLKSVLYGTSKDNLKPLLPSEAFKAASSDTYFYIVTSYDLGFDVDSEPGDADCEGEPKDDQIVNIEDGKVEISDPVRPGYIFQGWTIPNAEGTEALDQDLVYQGDDGKWYVDASKLPDYATDGRVELTARWTSVISVDVPSSVTFYADVVTQGNESREGLASSAFGQNKVQSQSEVDLRIVGLESKQVKGNGSTSLGASDILKKKDGGTVSGTADKLFSLYPATGELEEDDLKDPDATSASKPAGAVDFSLDDILLEKSFAADEFTIPAGDTLSLGYRLNLQETDTVLDYDKLSTLDEGTSASIANISYCFAADGVNPDIEPLWFENTNSEWGEVGLYGLADIKRAAKDLSSHVTASFPSDDTSQDSIDAYWAEVEHQAAMSSYYKLYKSILDDPDACPVYMKVNGVDHEVQVLGICQDEKADGTGKAGLTFGFRDAYALGKKTNSVAGATSFDTRMHDSQSSRGGWGSTIARSQLQGASLDDPTNGFEKPEDALFSLLDGCLRNEATGITKVSKIHQLGTSDGCGVQTTVDTVFIPSDFEVFGYSSENSNGDEKASLGLFQYQWFAKGGVGFHASSYRVKAFDGTPCSWWLRSADKDSYRYFGIVSSKGSETSFIASSDAAIVPCFAL